MENITANTPPTQNLKPESHSQQPATPTGFAPQTKTPGKAKAIALIVGLVVILGIGAFAVATFFGDDGGVNGLQQILQSGSQTQSISAPVTTSANVLENSAQALLAVNAVDISYDTKLKESDFTTATGISIDAWDPKNVVTSVNLVTNVNVNIITTNDKIFVQLVEFPDVGIFTENTKQQWLDMTSTLAPLRAKLDLSGKNFVHLFQAFSREKVLTVEAQLPTETLGNIQASHYALAFHGENTHGAVKEIGAFFGVTDYTEAESKKVADGLAAMQYKNLELWVDSATNRPLKMTGEYPTQTQNGDTFTDSFTVTFKNYDNKRKLVPPTNAKLFENVVNENFQAFFKGLLQTLQTQIFEKAGASSIIPSIYPNEHIR